MMSGTCSLEEYHRMAAEKRRALSRSTRILTSGRTGAIAVAAALRPWHGPAIANAKRLRRNSPGTAVNPAVYYRPRRYRVQPGNVG